MHVLFTAPLQDPRLKKPKVEVNSPNSPPPDDTVQPVETTAGPTGEATMPPVDQETITRLLGELGHHAYVPAGPPATEEPTSSTMEAPSLQPAAKPAGPPATGEPSSRDSHPVGPPPVPSTNVTSTGSASRELVVPMWKPKMLLQRAPPMAPPSQLVPPPVAKAPMPKGPSHVRPSETQGWMNRWVLLSGHVMRGEEVQARAHVAKWAQFTGDTFAKHMARAANNQGIDPKM